MTAWIENLKGRFIVFDGPDGSGKSTQFQRMAEACRAAGLTVCEVRAERGEIPVEAAREIRARAAFETARVLEIENIVQTSARGEGGWAQAAVDQSLAVRDDYCYLAASSGGLFVMDVTDPQNPAKVGYYNTGDTALHVDFKGRDVYVADSADAFDLVLWRKQWPRSDARHDNPKKYGSHG